METATAFLWMQIGFAATGWAVATILGIAMFRGARKRKLLAEREAAYWYDKTPSPRGPDDITAVGLIPKKERYALSRKLPIIK